MSDEPTVAELHLLARIREAVGDNGKLMQDELVEYCRELKRKADEAKTVMSEADELLRIEDAFRAMSQPFYNEMTTEEFAKWLIAEHLLMSGAAADDVDKIASLETELKRWRELMSGLVSDSRIDISVRAEWSSKAKAFASESEHAGVLAKMVALNDSVQSLTKKLAECETECQRLRCSAIAARRSIQLLVKVIGLEVDDPELGTCKIVGDAKKLLTQLANIT